MKKALDRVSGTSRAAPPTPWPPEWLRGLMEVCVLRAIAGGPTYGYAIAAALEQGGLGAPKGGTLYPLLGRLENAQWVSTRWGAGDGGPGRKFYELTSAGRAHLAEMTRAWEFFHPTVSHFLGVPVDPPTSHQGDSHE